MAQVLNKLNFYPYILSERSEHRSVTSKNYDTNLTKDEAKLQINIMSKNTKRSKASANSNYDTKLDKLSTNSDKFCCNCQKMNYSLAADSSTNLRLNYRCKFCNKLI